MKEAFDVLLKGVQSQLDVLREENKVKDSKEIQKAVPMAQLNILAILTTAVIMFIQNEVE